MALSCNSVRPEAYAEFARTAEVSQLIVSAAYSNACIARVLALKFAFLRAAFILAIVDVLGTIAYYVDMRSLWRAFSGT